MNFSLNSNLCVTKFGHMTIEPWTWPKMILFLTKRNKTFALPCFDKPQMRQISVEIWSGQGMSSGHFFSYYILWVQCHNSLSFLFFFFLKQEFNVLNNILFNQLALLCLLFLIYCSLGDSSTSKNSVVMTTLTHNFSNSSTLKAKTHWNLQKVGTSPNLFKKKLCLRAGNSNVSFLGVKFQKLKFLSRSHDCLCKYTTLKVE